MAIGLYYYGLRQTSATYASTFSNLVPVVTFLFSTVLGYASISSRMHENIHEFSLARNHLCKESDKILILMLILYFIIEKLGLKKEEEEGSIV